MAATLEQMNVIVQKQIQEINDLYQQLEALKKHNAPGERGSEGMTHVKHFNPGRYSNL